jgi:hypothetical protein
MSGYEELARQLRASVRELGTAAPSPRGPRRRHGLLVVLAALVVGGGVATAAQTGVLTARHDDGPSRSAAQLAAQVVRETISVHACRLVPAKVGATTVVASLPAPVAALVAGGDAAAMRAAQRSNHGGPVVAGSAREVRLPDGSNVVLWVALGQGGFTLADPGGCLAARVAQLARDLPDPGSRLRQKAETILRADRGTMPGAQTLWLFRPTRRGGTGGGGAGIPLDGAPLPTGQLLGGGGEYVGLTGPAAVRVSLDGRRLHRSVPVVGRVFVVRLPDRTGPVVLRLRAADGAVLKTQTLRG